DGGIGRHTGLKIRALSKRKNQPPQWFLSKSLFSLPFCNPSHSAHSAQALLSSLISSKKCRHGADMKLGGLGIPYRPTPKALGDRRKRGYVISTRSSLSFLAGSALHYP